MESLSIIMLWVIVVNIVWYYIKYLVSQHRYETHLFRGHFYDIIHFHQLIGKEQDEVRKRKYKIVMFAFYFVLILPFIIVLATFIGLPVLGGGGQ